MHSLHSSLHTLQTLSTLHSLHSLHGLHNLHSSYVAYPCITCRTHVVSPTVCIACLNESPGPWSRFDSKRRTKPHRLMKTWLLFSLRFVPPPPSLLRPRRLPRTPIPHPPPPPTSPSTTPPRPTTSPHSVLPLTSYILRRPNPSAPSARRFHSLHCNQPCVDS